MRSPTSPLVRIARLWLRAGAGLANLSALVLYALPLVIAADVLLRKSGRSTIWGFDVSLYLMVWLVYLGMADGLRTGSHFRVHLIIDRFPKVRPMIDLFDYFVIFLFGATLAFAGSQLVWTSYTTGLRSTTLLQTPLWIPELVLPIGGIALALDAIALAIVGPHHHPQDVPPELVAVERLS